jgi:signal transduction histidine kinase
MTDGASGFFEALAAETPFGIYVLDAQLRVAFFNAAAAAEFPDPGSIGRDFYELLLARHPERRAKETLELFRRTLTTGKPHVESIWRAPRDGEVRVYDWVLKRVRMPDGTNGVACYYHDVTAIQEAAAITAERAERDAFLVAFTDAVRPLTDASDITVLAAELLGKHLAANQVLYAEIDTTAHVGAVVHEWSDEHGALVTGAHPLTDIGPELLAELGRGLTAVIEDVHLAPMAGPLETYDRWSLRSFVVVPLVKNDRFVALLGALQRTPRRWLRTEVALVEEVAERTWSAVERARAESALRETNQRLREREERLAESDRKKDEFLAILAHELRNPLAPIRTGVEVIRRTGMASGGDAARVTEMMERQIGHMVRLIDDLLDISRITSGKIRLQRQSSDLRTLVDSAVEANRAAITTGGIHLSVDLPTTQVWLDVDPARFVQIVSNVLHNAVKFTDRSGTVALSARIEENALVLTVTDTGVGMSSDVLPRVFDLFMQDDETARRAPGGLGIGLALARRLVEMHGGAIDATSPGVGRGSTFTIWLPLDATDARPQPASEVATAPTPRRVVVIDDNRDAADAAAMFVEGLGSEVRVAYDGETGVGVAREFRPDLVLLDLGMEGVDGFETCRRIRAELGSDVYVVALTGWGQDHDKRATALAGFDAHLTKPADPAALERLIGGPLG